MVRQCLDHRSASLAPKDAQDVLFLFCFPIVLYSEGVLLEKQSIEDIDENWHLLEGNTKPMPYN